VYGASRAASWLAQAVQARHTRAYPYPSAPTAIRPSWVDVETTTTGAPPGYIPAAVAYGASRAASWLAQAVQARHSRAGPYPSAPTAIRPSWADLTTTAGRARPGYIPAAGAPGASRAASWLARAAVQAWHNRAYPYPSAPMVIQPWWVDMEITATRARPGYIPGAGAYGASRAASWLARAAVQAWHSGAGRYPSAPTAKRPWWVALKTTSARAPFGHIQ